MTVLCEPPLLCCCCYASQISLSCWNCSKHNSCHVDQKFSFICPPTVSPTARWLVPVIFGKVRSAERSVTERSVFFCPLQMWTNTHTQVRAHTHTHTSTHCYWPPLCWWWIHIILTDFLCQIALWQVFICLVKYSCFDNFRHGYLAFHILIYFQTVFHGFRGFLFTFLIKVKLILR